MSAVKEASPGRSPGSPSCPGRDPHRERHGGQLVVFDQNQGQAIGQFDDGWPRKLDAQNFLVYRRAVQPLDLAHRRRFVLRPGEPALNAARTANECNGEHGRASKLAKPHHRSPPANLRASRANRRRRSLARRGWMRTTCCRRQRGDHRALVAYQIFLGGRIHLIECYRVLLVDHRVDQIGIVKVDGISADQFAVFKDDRRCSMNRRRSCVLALASSSAVTPFFATAAISSSMRLSRDPRPSLPAAPSRKCKTGWARFAHRRERSPATQAAYLSPGADTCANSGPARGCRRVPARRNSPECCRAECDRPSGCAASAPADRRSSPCARRSAALRSGQLSAAAFARESIRSIF